jgi:hypothetical protein
VIQVSVVGSARLGLGQVYTHYPALKNVSFGSVGQFDTHFFETGSA